jgi:dihydroflavonol-4-reductase
MLPRALVLGATGHIGAHIVRALLAEGVPVRAAYHTPQHLSVLEGLPVERIQVDVEQSDGLRAALEGCEWVFYAAGYYPRHYARRTQAVARGVDAVRRVMRQAQAARPARVVFTSSAATIRQVPGRLANESDVEPWPLRAWRPLYAAVKIAMEQEALRWAQEGVPVVVVNPSLCIGEYDAHRFSGRAVLAFAKYRLPVYLEHHFNAVYTGDVGVGHVRAAQRGRVGERYLLTCRNLSVKEFADLVAPIAGVAAPRWRLPRSAALAIATLSELVAAATRTEPLLPRHAVHTPRGGQRLDGTKAVRELGLPQTPIEEAIRRAVAWFREYGVL